MLIRNSEIVIHLRILSAIVFLSVISFVLDLRTTGWRNFRHISRKIMKTTTTKKSSLGLGKIRQPNTRGKHTRNTKEQTHSRGTVIRVRFVSWCCQAGKAKPCERCMHACIWGRETFLLFLSLVQLCEKNVFCTKFRRGLFCGKTTIGGKTIERIVETWRP